MTIYEIVHEVLQPLDRNGTDYLLVGAIATGAWAIPRSTTDADFVVSAPAAEVDRLLSSLPRQFKIDPQSRLEPFTGTMRWVINVEGTEFKVEVFLQGNDPHHIEERRRKKLVHLKMLNRTAWIPTAEDIIIQKLRWSRKKDLQDVEDILSVSGKSLDLSYIEKWCREHGTWERFEEIRHSIPEI